MLARPRIMKRYILLFGVLGLVGCFLPFIGGTSLTIFDLKRHHYGLVAVIAFAMPVYAIVRASYAQAVVAGLIGFALAACTFHARAVQLVLYAGIGGKLIGVAVLGGLLASIGGVLELRTARVTR